MNGFVYCGILASVVALLISFIIKQIFLKEELADLKSDHKELKDRLAYEKELRYKAEGKYERLTKDITFIRAKEDLKKKLMMAIANDCLFIPIDNNLIEVWNKDKEYLWDITDTLMIKRCKKSTNDQIRKMETIITDNIWEALNHPIVQDRDGVTELIYMVNEIKEDLMITEVK